VDTLDVADNMRIPMSEIRMTAVRSQGAGGQNVNKVATAIHLRFDVQNSPAVPDRIKLRLRQLSDHRITEDGVIVIKSQAHRSQDRNRQAALSRLTELLGSASREQKRRIKTKPSRQAKLKRLDDKSRRGTLKKTRRNFSDD
jgi:ribosome-associated protein